MARMYANENFPQPTVAELRRFGHDVLTSHEAGNSGRSVPDFEVLQFANAQNRAVLTLNRRHFVGLHGRHPQHRGIIVCSYDPDFSELALRIHGKVSAIDDLAGQLLRVNRPG